MQRLHGLLGDSDAVEQQGGRIALARDRVWVDAWQFEAGLVAARGSRGGSPSALADALALYRGQFLAEEEGDAWPVAMRERLRAKFIDAVAGHAGTLESSGHDDEAIAWYQRGLGADPLVERFYQGLMRCYHRAGRLPEAVSSYRRLKQALSITLSLPPSESTERLYQRLRLG